MYTNFLSFLVGELTIEIVDVEDEGDNKTFGVLFSSLILSSSFCLLNNSSDIEKLLLLITIDGLIFRIFCSNLDSVFKDKLFVDFICVLLLL